MRLISGWKARLNGARGERQASRYLCDQGLTLVEKNFHCKWGEIDLIFKQQSQLIFVEVKSRENAEFGHAAEYFTEGKRKKFHKSVMTYLAKHNLNPELTDFRIDLIAITGNNICWLKAV